MWQRTCLISLLLLPLSNLQAPPLAGPRTQFDPGRDPLACALHVLTTSSSMEEVRGPARSRCGSDRSTLGGLIAWTYQSIDSLDAALEVARVLDDSALVVRLLASQAARLYGEGRDVEARRALVTTIAAADRITVEPSRARSWIAVSRAHLAAGDIPAASAVLAHAESLRTTEPSTWVDAHLEVAKHLAAAGEVESALAVAATMPDPYGFATASRLGELTIALVNARNLDAALDVAESITSGENRWYGRMQARRAVALGMAVDGRWSAAEEQATTLRDVPAAEAEVLVAVAERADSAGEIGVAKSLARKALSLAIANDWTDAPGNTRQSTLIRLSGLLVRVGDADGGLRAARSIVLEDPSDGNARGACMTALVRAACALAQSGDPLRAAPVLREARALAEEMGDPTDLSMFLVGTADDVEDAGYPELVVGYREQALMEARKLPPGDRAYALYWNLTNTPWERTEERARIVQEAYFACREIEDPALQARMLIYLARAQVICVPRPNWRASIALRSISRSGLGMSYAELPMYR